jgi:hypothetical protein
MRPRRWDRVANTRGALIGYVQLYAERYGPQFTVLVGSSFYRILEWDRSWGAWIAFGRGKRVSA